MSFVLSCPHCGIREVTDFAFGGETNRRPTSAPSARELNTYNYFRRNVAGVQREWWCHRSGCRAWFIAERDTRTNRVHFTALPADVDAAAGAYAGQTAAGVAAAPAAGDPAATQAAGGHA